jgi:hypothetical protein
MDDADWIALIERIEAWGLRVTSVNRSTGQLTVALPDIYKTTRQ